MEPNKCFKFFWLPPPVKMFFTSWSRTYFTHMTGGKKSFSILFHYSNALIFLLSLSLMLWYNPLMGGNLQYEKHLYKPFNRCDNHFFDILPLLASTLVFLLHPSKKYHCKKRCWSRSLKNNSSCSFCHITMSKLLNTSVSQFTNLQNGEIQ